MHNLIERRITISGIKKHPWFLKNLPTEIKNEMEGRPEKTGFLTKIGLKKDRNTSQRQIELQSEDEIRVRS